ncbi:MAG TPA: alpha/beta hydrolase [Dehalococcoidales bacterium]|nr:alpha/beta hydrolase [Dehalococcoidales bacterium]
MNSQRPLQVNNPRFFRKSRYGRDKFVLIRRDRIHYVDAGQGEPVIWIPGSRSSFRIWNRLFPALEKNYHLMALDALDLKDLNHAGKVEESIRRQADLIAALIDQLKLGKVNLISGHTGSAVAFNLAARYANLVERLVSLAGYIGIGPAPPDHDSNSQTKQDVVKNLNLEEEAKAVKCPILYLYGSKTNLREVPLKHNLAYLQKNHPQAWIVSLEGGIFETAVANPREITALLADFFKYKPGIRIG